VLEAVQNGANLMAHTCHAIACKLPVPPERLMCLRHWRRVPKELQRAVWRTYRVGQCDDLSPSSAYCDAGQAAVRAVAQAEGRVVTGLEPEMKLYDVFQGIPS
jgi:hypothetical protein